MVINKIVIFGALLILVAITAVLYTIIFRMSAYKTRGVVIRKIHRGNGYVPVVQITYQGCQQNVECNEMCKCNQYMEGEEIEVYFNPSNTNKVYIVGNNSSFVTNTLLIGLGVFIVFFGMNM